MSKKWKRIDEELLSSGESASVGIADINRTTYENIKKRWTNEESRMGMGAYYLECRGSMKSLFNRKPLMVLLLF